MNFTALDLNKFESSVDEKGYVRIYVGEGVHPKSSHGFVYEHRVVMENHIGRYLEPQEVIHHINEVKTDNRIYNLFLCSAEEHVAIHNRGRVNSLAKKAKIRAGVYAANRRKNQKNEREG